jgi:hypothetical protein
VLPKKKTTTKDSSGEGKVYGTHEKGKRKEIGVKGEGVHSKMTG